jgi:hypothetical protein
MLTMFPALRFFDIIADFEKYFFCSFGKGRATVSNTKSHNDQCYSSASQSVRPFVLSFLHLARCNTKWQHIVGP